MPVFTTLSAGGFQDPQSQSAQANALLDRVFHQGGQDLLLLVSSQSGALSPAVSVAGRGIVDELSRSSHVARVESPWDAKIPPGAANPLVSADGKSALILAGINGGEKRAHIYARELADRFTRTGDGVTVLAGGSAAVNAAVIEQTKTDLLHMELLAVPVTFFALVWVFGGLLAAALPIAVAGFAMIGSLAALQLISMMTDTSIFALNVTMALSLALAVDYTLLIISRYREEVAAGAATHAAITRTMSTAGRTVLFSALIVALSLAAMSLFPMYFLKSFAYAGVATVAFAALAAIVVAPAAIVMLGSRLDACDVRRLLRRPATTGRHHRTGGVETTFFYRSTRFVMRHAVAFGLLIVSLLCLLGTPFLGVKWGFPDDRVLPLTAQARQVGDRIRSGFTTDWPNRVTIVVPATPCVVPPDFDGYAGELSRVAKVTAVSAPSGTYVAGARVGPASAPTGLSGGNAFLSVDSSAVLFSPDSTAQLAALHTINPPDGRTVLFTGAAQFNRDSVDAITSRLPLVLGTIALVELVLLFGLTGSAVLPFKALVLNALSLTATFGALVWIFQEGHLGALGTTPTGTLVATIPVLMFCITFGLSMDYEVFLISRIREYWLASKRTQADNDESIALGVAHTGRVVTAAALLMSISFAGLIAGQVSFIRIFGVGLTIAILADATLIRVILVPAFMHLFGRLNWWAPASLRRLHIQVTVDAPVADMGTQDGPARLLGHEGSQ